MNALMEPSLSGGLESWGVENGGVESGVVENGGVESGVLRMEDLRVGC